MIQDDTHLAPGSIQRELNRQAERIRDLTERLHVVERRNRELEGALRDLAPAAARALRVIE